jgi:hypothetical protein
MPLTPAEIENVFASFDNTVEREVLDENGSGKPNGKARPTSLNAEALSYMMFTPIKYVVPGIIVEGLTLFAGKPKVGKS